MIGTPAIEPVFDGLPAARGYGREVLATLPGAAVLVFDLDLRVCVAEGDGFPPLGLESASLEGCRLPDALSAPVWAELSRPCESALAGHTTTVDFSSRGLVYSIQVSPLQIAGAIVGARALAREVTDQRRLEALLAAQEAVARDLERRLAAVFDRAPTAMCIIDLAGRWLRVNDALCQTLGYQRDELLDKSVRDLTHPDDVREDIERLSRLIAGGPDRLGREKRYIARDGSTVWVHVRAEMIHDDDGRPAYIVSQVQNVAERCSCELLLDKSERRLRSILDNMHGAVSVKGRDHRYQIVNPAFERRFDLERGWIVGRTDEEILTAGAVALDRDGDDLVLRTGELVEQEEVVAHHGEDRVYLTLKFPLRDENSDVYAVCSIFTDVTDRKRRAQELHDRLEWTDRIRHAVAEERLVLHAQPILNLASGEVEQAELLVRMLGSQGSSTIIPPGEFLPAAERFDLVAIIDRWVVARAVELAGRGHRVEVNLSGKTISDGNQVAEIERIVADSGAPPANIIFEITETAAAENLDAARHFAQRLRAIGCSFALDDFGVGFGAFTYLKHLAVDYLKIDIEFVRDLIRNETDRQVVQAIVGVAREFGMKTIAEGVEDQETLELLGRIGVDYAQGYWIGPPKPIDKLWPTTAKTARRK